MWNQLSYDPISYMISHDERSGHVSPMKVCHVAGTIFCKTIICEKKTRLFKYSRLLLFYCNCFDYFWTILAFLSSLYVSVHVCKMHWHAKILSSVILYCFIISSVTVNPLTAEQALRALIDFTLSNARRFYSSKGNPLDGKGLRKKYYLQSFVPKENRVSIYPSNIQTRIIQLLSG